MPRNKLGQFEPGTCGNPRGRPRKLRRKIRPDQPRKHFFEAGETLVPIIEKGSARIRENSKLRARITPDSSD
jgi:hypothetical protein